MKKTTSPGKKNTMSGTTFSNMSSPDILLTIHAYTFMQTAIKLRIEMLNDQVEIYRCEIKLERLDQLIDALLDEYMKR
jgi:hypothetical protein